MPRNSDVMAICDFVEAELRPRPKFDKRAYQREYMRKWRAAGKA